MAYQIDFYCNLIHWFINYDIRVGVGVWEGPKLNDEYEQPLRPVSFKIETIRQSLNATNGKTSFPISKSFFEIRVHLFSFEQHGVSDNSVKPLQNPCTERVELCLPITMN